MTNSVTEQALPLGRVLSQQLEVPACAYQASRKHAQQIADELGSADVQSSLAAYWSLESRLRQWQYLLVRIGMLRARTARFIEIGSGMGLFTLVGRALGFNIVGIEPSRARYDASLRIARDLFAHNDVALSLAQAPAEALPLPDASVDSVVSFQTLEHVADLPQTLRELRRVLVPGGTLFAQVPNYAAWYEAHYGLFVPLAWGKSWTRHYFRFRGKPTGFLEHLQWLTPALLRRMLETAGFTQIHVGKAVNPPLDVDRFDAALAPLPFHFRRGQLARVGAYALAYAAEQLRFSSDLYPQLEVWAIA
jgi:SAM-dependent methyltransferase